jgi:hypothetical protein
MGPCVFDLGRMSFQGEPAEQARCLLNPVQQVGRLGPPLAVLPVALGERVGKTFDAASGARLAAWLAQSAFADPLGRSLDQPVSRTENEGRPASYFVIHDTSTPNYGGAAWPKNLDADEKVNNLNRYRCDNKIERAHVFINRGGSILLAHDFAVPWRATKFEMATNFSGRLKGLFLHIELVQPRRRHPKYGRGNDYLAPEPGFTPAQYDALAASYAVASMRARMWLIPAFHAVLDEGIRNKHDDPQNFDLAAFAASLDRLFAAQPAAEAKKSGQ